MKAVIDINKKTMDRLSGSLDLPSLYDENGEVDEDELSYAIELIVELCAVE